MRKRNPSAFMVACLLVSSFCFGPGTAFAQNSDPETQAYTAMARWKSQQTGYAETAALELEGEMGELLDSFIADQFESLSMTNQIAVLDGLARRTRAWRLKIWELVEWALWNAPAPPRTSVAERVRAFEAGVDVSAKDALPSPRRAAAAALFGQTSWPASLWQRVAEALSDREIRDEFAQALANQAHLAKGFTQTALQILKRRDRQSRMIAYILGQHSNTPDEVVAAVQAELADVVQSGSGPLTMLNALSGVRVLSDSFWKQISSILLTKNPAHFGEISEFLWLRQGNIPVSLFGALETAISTPIQFQLHSSRPDLLIEPPIQRFLPGFLHLMEALKGHPLTEDLTQALDHRMGELILYVSGQHALPALDFIANAKHWPSSAVATVDAALRYVHGGLFPAAGQSPIYRAEILEGVTMALKNFESVPDEIMDALAVVLEHGNPALRTLALQALNVERPWTSRAWKALPRALQSADEALSMSASLAIAHQSDWSNGAKLWMIQYSRRHPEKNGLKQLVVRHAGGTGLATQLDLRCKIAFGSP